MSNKLAIITLLFLGGITAEFTSVSQVCQSLGPKFTIYGTTEPIDFNLEDAYKKGVMVGKGGFGEVHKALFGFSGIQEVAIKFVKNEPLVLKEFDVLTKFSPMNVGPKFYGCQYTSRSIMIAQTLLYKDLSKDSTMLRLKKVPNSQFLERIRDVVDSLRTMWDNNYVHMDIKEHNIMTNKDFSKFYLIDFGLAQRKDHYMASAGTPFYFSPTKWTSRYSRPQPKDDLYSVALTIGILEAVSGFDELVQYELPNGLISVLPNSCFNIRLTSDCQQVLKTNVRRILRKSNYGEYHRSPKLRQKETINFTTLVALMINYADYPFDYDQTVDILDRLITEFKILEGAGVTKTKQKTSDFTDPEDKPDTYDAGRTYPRVHPAELTKFENAWKFYVEPELLKEELEEENWQLKLEEQKLLKEAEEERARLEAERIAKQAEEARKEKEAKEKHEKELQEAALRLKQILADKAERDRQKQLEIQKQEMEKRERERKDRERKKLIEDIEREEKYRKEALARHEERLRRIQGDLRKSQKKVDGIEQKFGGVQRVSQMQEANPVLFQKMANQVNLEEQSKKNNQNAIFSPKQNLNEGVKPVLTKTPLADLIKHTNMNKYVPTNLPPSFDNIFDKINKVQEMKHVKIGSGEPMEIENGTPGKVVDQVDVEKRVIFGKPVKQPEVQDIYMKKIVPKKPEQRLGDNNAMEIEKPAILNQKKRVYVYLGGRREVQVLNENGVWVRAEEDLAKRV